MRQFRMRFGRCQLGQNPNRASFFVRVKSWEIIADNLKKRGWSLGWMSAIDSQGRTIWILTLTATMESGSLCAQMKC